MTKKETAVQQIKYKIKRQVDKSLLKFETETFRYLLLNVIISGKKGLEEHEIYIPSKVFKNKKFLNKHVLDYHFTTVAERMIETKTFLKKVKASPHNLSIIEED